MMAATECGELTEAAGFSLLARRNNSLSSAGRHLVFVFLFAVSVGIAAAFAALGAWLILPFAGLEMLVLYWAFRTVDRHAADYERIAVRGDRVRVEVFEVGRARRHEFSRCWTQLVVSRDGGRIVLRFHGREVEVGRHRDDAQRRTFARELGQLLRGA